MSRAGRKHLSRANICSLSSSQVGSLTTTKSHFIRNSLCSVLASCLSCVYIQLCLWYVVSLVYMICMLCLVCAPHLLRLNVSIIFMQEMYFLWFNTMTECLGGTARVTIICFIEHPDKSLKYSFFDLEKKLLTMCTNVVCQEEVELSDRDIYMIGINTKTRMKTIRRFL